MSENLGYKFRRWDLVEVVEMEGRPFPVGGRRLLGYVGWVSANAVELKERSEFSGMPMWRMSDWYGVVLDGEEWQIPEGRLRLVWRKSEEEVCE